MIVFGQKLLYSGKVNDIEQKWLSSCKVVVFMQSGNIREKGCIRAELVVFGQCGCIRTNVVAFVQNGSIRERLVVLLQSGCDQAKWL